MSIDIHTIDFLILRLVSTHQFHNSKASLIMDNKSQFLKNITPIVQYVRFPNHTGFPQILDSNI